MSTLAHTHLGTPCAPAWDPSHLELVTSEESRLNRRICGGRLLSGRPCLMHPTHDNGRCPHHGGFPGTGAQPANHNARVHGLYARAVQKCGPHCAQWRSCPFASEAVLALPEADRPDCPYEAAQYEQAAQDGLERAARNPNADAMDTHLVHAMAMTQVMLLRAAAALSVQPLVLTETQHRNGVDHERTRTQPALTAVLRLSSEFRRYLHLLTPEEQRQPAARPATPTPPAKTAEDLAREAKYQECDAMNRRSECGQQLTALFLEFRTVDAEAQQQILATGEPTPQTAERLAEISRKIYPLAEEYERLTPAWLRECTKDKPNPLKELLAFIPTPT